MNDKDRRALVESATEAVSESREVIDWFKRSFRKRWEGLAGSELSTMLQSISTTVEYLKSPNPRLREAALFALSDHWGLSQSLLPVLEIVLLNDEDDNIRGLALLHIGDLYRGTNDKAIGVLFAGIVRNENLSIEFRTSAYHALFGLQGLSSECWPNTWSPEWRFADDVNWSFVDSFK